MLDFELKKAFHAKQAAYDEMTAAREKANALNQILMQQYLEVERLQAAYDEARAKQDDDWANYNNRQLELKKRIGDKITSVKEANILAENLRLMAEDPNEDPAKAEVYLEGSRMFSSIAMQKIVERDELIAEKRGMIRPDNRASQQALEVLKAARQLQAEKAEAYHNAKNEYSLKKTKFDHLNEKYIKLQNGDNSSNTFTNRPEKLEYDERLLVKANIPREYWGNCELMKRADGKIDVYYGGDDNNFHGHVVLVDDQVEYARLPRLKAPALAH